MNTSKTQVTGSYDADDAPETEFGSSYESANRVPSLSGRLKKSEKGEPVTGKMWAKQGDNYFPCDTAVSELGAGFYVINQTQSGEIFYTQMVPVTDELFEVPNSASTRVIEQIETFWKSEEKFKAKNLVWKRGIMLFGPPGSGKTSTIHLVSKRVIERGGIVFFCEYPGLASAGLRQFRVIEPKRPILLILEDIDAMVVHQEGPLLSLLDGEVQVDNIVIIATTNYPEKLDKRVVDRPRRIDVIQKIDAPNAEMRRFFLMKKSPELASEFMPVAEPDRTLYDKQTGDLTALIQTGEEELATLKAAAGADPLLALKHEARITELTKGIETRRESLKKLQDEFNAIQPERTSVLDFIVNGTQGLGLSHLTEIIISIQVFDYSAEKAVNRMMKMHTTRLDKQSGEQTNI